MPAVLTETELYDNHIRGCRECQQWLGSCPEGKRLMLECIDVTCFVCGASIHGTGRERECSNEDCPSKRGTGEETEELPGGSK